jgi:hypothetical protein
VAIHPLDVTSAALLERLDKEDARAPTTAKSHLIGGVAAVGSKLDGFLRELLVEIADAGGRAPTEFLPHVGQRTVSLRKATAGQLLRSIQDAAEGLSGSDRSKTRDVDREKRGGRAGFWSPSDITS